MIGTTPIKERTEIAYGRRMKALRASRNALIREYPELKDWEAWLALEGKSEDTLENYMYTAVRFVERYGFSLLEATDSALLEFLRSLPPGSRRTRRAHLASFYAFARLTRRIEGNPLDFVPKIKPPARKVVDVFESWEQAALIQEDPGRMALLLFCGLRRGEACRLQAKDVDFESLRLVVRQGKGGKGRLVEFGELCASRAADMFLVEGIGRDQYIWSSRPGGGVIRRDRPVGESTFIRWWTGRIEAAGVEYRNPHTTRHTYATNALRAGVRLERLQELMGHASIQTTKDLYGHLNSLDRRADVDLLDKMLLETVEKPRRIGPMDEVEAMADRMGIDLEPRR